MKKIIIILFLSIMWTQVFAAENTDVDLFDDIEALLQESDSDVKQREALEQQAQIELDWKYKTILHNFDFPPDTCGRPKLYVPTTNDGFQRLANRLNSWQRCQYRLEEADLSSLRQLIIDLDGEWTEHDQYVSWNLDKNKSINREQIKPLWDQLNQRSDMRDENVEILHTFFTEHADNFHAEIERHNRQVDRQNRRNFWLDALKGMEQGMREYNQQHYQQY